MADYQVDEKASEGSSLGLEEQQALSRRQFLRGSVVGGAAGLALGAGASAAAWKIADAQVQAELDAANAEVARLQGLVALYEDLDKVGLDAILAAGMGAMALPVQAVEAGAKALKSGLEWIEGVLMSAQEALPTARESLGWLEGRVATLADGISKLEDAVGRALDRAADNPVVGALKDFSSLVLDNLPFGLGERIREVLEGLVEVVSGADELVRSVNTHFLDPMRSSWFADEEMGGIGASLVHSFSTRILDPLEAHLEDLALLAETWEKDMVAPTAQAVARRAEIQEQIEKYKRDRALG